MQKLRYLLSGDSVKWIIERKNTLETFLVAYAFFFFFSFFFFFCFVLFFRKEWAYEAIVPLFYLPIGISRGIPQNWKVI